MMVLAQYGSERSDDIMHRICMLPAAMCPVVEWVGDSNGNAASTTEWVPDLLTSIHVPRQIRNLKQETRCAF